MKSQSQDTSLETERLQIALFRNAPAWRRLRLVQEINQTTRILMVQGWRRQHPGASDAKLRQFVAERWLGEDLAARAYAMLDSNLVWEEHVPMSTSPIAVTLLVVEQLDRLGIPYLLGGSLASSALGVPRSTLDADLIADIPAAHAPALVQALEGTFLVDLDAVHEAIRHHGSFNLVHLESMFKVDIFLPKRRHFDREQMARRVLQMVSTDPERSLYVASAEDTVLAKLEWYRLHGEASDRQWGDILGVLKVQAQALDRHYLWQAAASLEVGDLLDRALADAGLA